MSAKQIRSASSSASWMSVWLTTTIVVVAAGCSESTPPRTSPVPVGSAAAPSGTGPEERYAGTYLSAGSDTERAVIRAAVDYATEGMVGKNIALGELMKRSEVRPSYAL